MDIQLLVQEHTKKSSVHWRQPHTWTRCLSRPSLTARQQNEQSRWHIVRVHLSWEQVSDPTITNTHFIRHARICLARQRRSTMWRSNNNAAPRPQHPTGHVIHATHAVFIIYMITCCQQPSIWNESPWDRKFLICFAFSCFFYAPLALNLHPV